MKKICTILFILSLNTSLVFAQTAGINISSNPIACLNKISKIPISTTALFGAENRFTVQITADNSNNNTKIYEFSGTLKNNNIEVVINDSTLTSLSYLYLRVISSSPSIQSNWIGSFQVYYQGNVTLLEPAQKVFNESDPVTLKLTGYSNSSWGLTFSDSSKISYHGGAFNRAFLAEAKVFPEKTQNFTIAHAENVCGNMRVSGSAKVVVNSISVKTVRATPEALCQTQSAELKVYFAVGSGSLPKSAKYKIRFTPLGDYGVELVGTEGFDSDAKLVNGVLVTQIPSQIKVIKSTPYSVRVIVDEPAIIGTYEKIYVIINPEPKVEITSVSATISPGESYFMSLKYSGASPFVIHLSDGTDVNGYGSGNSYYYAGKELKPMATTEYSIKSVESVCGITPINDSPVLKLTVPQAIYLSEWKESKRYCQGEKIRMKFMSNVTLPAGVDYKVEVGIGSALNQTINATRVGEYIEFIAPEITVFPYTPFYRSKVFSLKLIVGSVESIRVDGFTIQSKPEIHWNNYNNTFYFGENYLNYTILGGGPYNIVKENGVQQKVVDDNVNRIVILSKTESFGIKSISNECFVNDKLPVL